MEDVASVAPNVGKPTECPDKRQNVQYAHAYAFDGSKRIAHNLRTGCHHRQWYWLDSPYRRCADLAPERGWTIIGDAHGKRGIPT